MNKITQERIVKCTEKLIYELIGCQINSKLIKQDIDSGIVDIPLFSIRYRFLVAEDIREDVGWEVILIPSEDDITFDKVFWILVKKGYFHYLRTHLSSHTFIHFLEIRDLWKQAILIAIEDLDGKNKYKLTLLKSWLKKQPLFILQEYPAAFDWILGG